MSDPFAPPPEGGRRSRPAGRPPWEPPQWGSPAGSAPGEPGGRAAPPGSYAGSLPAAYDPAHVVWPADPAEQAWARRRRGAAYGFTSLAFTVATALLVTLGVGTIVIFFIGLVFLFAGLVTAVLAVAFAFVSIGIVVRIETPDARRWAALAPALVSLTSLAAFFTYGWLATR